MSPVLINRSLTELAKLRQVGDALEDLLGRLARMTTVSVETRKILGAMTSAAR